MFYVVKVAGELIAVPYRTFAEWLAIRQRRAVAGSKVHGGRRHFTPPESCRIVDLDDWRRSQDKKKGRRP